MADAGWRQGGSAQPETGIGQVLAAFATRGGTLLGARRSPENPLTLTHVRWEDASGYQLEAVRRPEIEAYLTEVERNIWVQLALHFPMTQAMEGAGWQPLAIQPAEAGQLASQIQRSRPATSLPPGMDFMRPGGPAGPGSGAPMRPSEASYNGPSQYGGMAANRPQPFPPSPQHQQQPPDTASWLPREAPQSGPLPPPPDRGSWFDGQDEVSAIPCVEIELPPVLVEPSAAEAAREFTRDVAAHFKRAAFTIPQTREARGWMRAGRLVLAARLVVARGTRPPNQVEMEQAAYLLADALSRRTLPYSRMTIADPGEWGQGVALPD